MYDPAEVASRIRSQLKVQGITKDQIKQAVELFEKLSFINDDDGFIGYDIRNRYKFGREFIRTLSTSARLND